MENIKNIHFTECDHSNFIRPTKMHFVQDGRQRTWDLLRVHDSVATVIYNTSRKVLVFVRQFRPAVYLSHIPFTDMTGKIDTNKYPPKLGLTLELCAGIVDKNKSLAEITQEEILEECGYNVPLENIKKVTTYRSGVGIAGSVQNLFYTEVTDEMKVSQGGGLHDEGELIEVVEITPEEAHQMLFDENISKPPSMMFGIMWFLRHKEIPIKTKL